MKWYRGRIIDLHEGPSPLGFTFALVAPPEAWRQVVELLPNSHRSWAKLLHFGEIATEGKRAGGGPGSRGAVRPARAHRGNRQPGAGVMTGPIEDIVGRCAEARGTRAYYESCGAGPAFDRVHSAGTDSRLFRHTLPALAELGFRAIALDLPGHGKSFLIDRRPLEDLHDFVRWIMEFAGVVGADPPVVAGCSIGGNIAIDVAVRHSPDVRACNA
jgi:hypothetical protein